MGTTQITDHGIYGGQMLREARLESAELSLSILNFGAATRDLRYLVGGANRRLVLGYKNPGEYIENPDYMGAFVGRVAGRIKNARFDLDGQTHQLNANEGGNQLHGGPSGLSHQFWHFESVDCTKIRLTHTSPDRANGYPGQAVVSILVALTGNRVTYDVIAKVDRPTPISLAQHNYYNLAGGGEPIWDHQLQVDATGYLVLDDSNVPNGAIASLSGTRYDVSQPVRLDQLDPEYQGSDIALCLRQCRDIHEPVAQLRASDGLTMSVWTNQPVAQFYTASGMIKRSGGLHGQCLGPGMGVCFEPQGFPNAVNLANFPSVIATSVQPYRQRLELEFGWT